MSTISEIPRESLAHHETHSDGDAVVGLPGGSNDNGAPPNSNDPHTDSVLSTDSSPLSIAAALFSLRGQAMPAVTAASAGDHASGRGDHQPSLFGDG